MIWLTTSKDLKILVNPATFQEVLPSEATRNVEDGAASRILYNCYDGEDIFSRDVKETPEEIESLIQNNNPIINLHYEIRSLIVAMQNWSH